MEKWRGVLFLLLAVMGFFGLTDAKPRQILLDTDMNTDDFFALFYLLKQNRSEFDLKAVTINSNAWTDAGHAVNQLYDILYMMDRDDIPVGVGGEGEILDNSTILLNVGGYLPIIEQGISTAGYCRYRQAIPIGSGGRLDSDTNYGIRRGFLPQVFHAGIPITLVPLDATNTIPINEEFFMAFEQQQVTYEAQYSFQSLKIVRDTWFDSQFYTSYFMWDSFTSGVALSIMCRDHNYSGENDFADMQYLNITVITSNKPYGIHDGSNPFFDERAIPKFNLQNDGIHDGHVQIGIQDPFCLVKGKSKGLCKDGYTKEITGSEAVSVFVAKKAKPNRDISSPLNREFFKSFLKFLNLPRQSGRFNFTSQFPYYREVLYKPNFVNQTRGKPVVFDMDMSSGDFLSLIYLLKVPVEIMDLKGILVSGNGWANAATIDVVYDVLHMMGRDDILVGLGNVTALETPSLSCKYVKAIPHGSGGFIDSDTLFGLARTFPRSPRRYTAENSVKYGAPRNTDHPELRQPLALEVWQSILREVNLSAKITILTNGPLTNLANIILSDKNASSIIEHVYIVGGHINDGLVERGNVFTFPSNKYAEFNMFLDPLAAKTVIESDLEITLIPLKAQHKVTSFPVILDSLHVTKKTPESMFAHRLLSLLHELQQRHHAYSHVDIFLGEILGAVLMVDQFYLNTIIIEKPISVLAGGNLTKDGQITIDEENGKFVNILDDLDSEAYYSHFANLLGDERQSAVISSFDEQIRQWNTPPNKTGRAKPVEDFSDCQ